MATGNGVAVVLIPSQDDYVWRISSEKVPHMTLLYLGEQVENIQGITEYVEHVANTSMCRLGLEVIRRGELGPKQADVLFFGEYYKKKLLDVRSYLLKNEDIFRAYNSTEQFPEFIPHLTLGYPETPAKPDEREYPGINWVQFDRVALWTGDYEGPEFILKDEYSLEMSMNDRVNEALAHYGIPGMKWGVRRTRKQIDRASADYKSARKIREKARTQGVKSLTNKQLRIASDRLAAEKRYSELSSSASSFTRGHNVVRNILAVGGTVTAAYGLATSPAARAGVSFIRSTIGR